MPTQMIDQLLRDAKTIAIVGISNRPERDSFKVADYLQTNGYRILAINPLLVGNLILGEICYSSLKEAQQQTGLIIDIVDCFRKASDVTPIVQDAINVNATVLWMQLGISNEEAAQMAQKAGMQVVMNRCIKIEHKRLRDKSV